MSKPVSGNDSPVDARSLKAANSLRGFARPFLITAGVQHVSAQYEGSDDEGSISDIHMTPALEIDLDAIRINFHAGLLEVRTLTGTMTQPLRTILDWMFMYYVYADFPDFETGQGGAGRVTWNVQGNMIQVEDSEFFTDSITTIKEY